MVKSDMTLLTPAEAARRLRVAPVTLRMWADKGLLRSHVTAGGHRRYPESEVERLLKMSEVTSKSSAKIMIVDDDTFTAEILQDFLSDLASPPVIEVAHDGFEAGRKLLEFQPDIILLDLMMPGLDGFSVCHQVKNDRTTAHIRIIAITGQASEENIKRILSEGAEACLAKPVDHTELLATLKLAGFSPEDRQSHTNRE